MNKNDAIEDDSIEDVFIQKRNSDGLKNSIRKLENVIEINDNLIKSLDGLTDNSDETSNLIAKDIDDIEGEILSLDEDIIGLLEITRMTDNAIHNRVRHKRETAWTLSNLDPIAIRLYTPLLEQKKREKRLVQQKLAEVRDEFIRCKKAAPGETSTDCDGVYHRVMDRFREITKKLKEIEEIVEEMEHFSPSGRSNEAEERKKKKDKKKKESSEESEESSEKKKLKKTSTAMPLCRSTVDPTEDPTETPIDFNDVTDTTDDVTIETTEFSSPKPRELQLSAAHDGREEDVVWSSERTSTISTTEITTCPAAAFNDQVFVRPKFQEDIEDHHSPMKFYEEHPSLDDLVRNKLERNQRGPFTDTISDLVDGANLLVDGAKQLFEDTQPQNDESFEVEKAQNSAAGKNSDFIGASGPFMSLCEQMAKQNQGKQNQPEQPVIPPQFHNNNFNQFQIPLSNFGSAGFHTPLTTETSKGSAKVMMNPGFNVMPYPVCFVNYPQQYRFQQQAFYYPGMIPITQPGGKHDTIDPEFIRSGGA